MSRIRWVLVLAALAFPSLGAAQQSGTVTGTIVDATTQQPLQSVQVMIVGTSRGTLTNQQGRFVIPNVPAGPQEVRVTQLGYGSASEEINIGAGQTATVDFSLTQSAVAIEGVIVTATGETRARREIGNSVATIEVADVPLAAVTNFSQLLQGRSAGVSVLQSSGTSGAAARVRIRGSNSISLSNEPLLVIDGVRIDNNTTGSIGVGGQEPSRLNDLNPDDIANVEILKGPAASALYGTAAANGVIQITTRRGAAGETQWRAYTEQGTLYDANDYPANFANETGCQLYQAAAGQCDADPNLISFSPLEDSRSTPFRTGYRGKYGISASGGSERATYYFSGDYELENGIYEINNLDRVNLRANVRAELSENWDLTLTSGFLSSDLSLPQNDNNTLGIISNGLLGMPEYNEDTQGYDPVGPNQIFHIDTRQNVRRTMGSVTSNWRPLPWLSFTGIGGMDLTSRHDHELIPPNRVFFGSLPEGERTSNRAEISNYTANLNSTAEYGINDSLTGSTSAGVQFNQDLFRGSYAFGAGLLAGTGSLAGTGERFSVDEENTDVRTLGIYAQQQLTWNDRVYGTVSIRGDRNSAFGQDFGTTYYPSASLSWVVTDEAWFPQASMLSSMRLRGAVGRSGLSPDFRDAITYLDPTPVIVQNEEVPGFTIGGTGNEDLRPEQSTEVEVGFEAGFFEDRFGVDFTFYNKESTDALVARRLAPSLGLSSTRFDNLGKVRNRGVELGLDARMLDLQDYQWNARLSYSHNDNELLELGEGIEPIIFGLGGDSQRHQEGYPLGAYFQVPFTYEDANNDGLLSSGEVQMADEAEYLGNPFSPHQGSFSSDLTLMRLFRISALVDWQRGGKLLNSTHEFRCLFGICRDVYDPSTSLDAQAAFIADAFQGSVAGFIEDASFTKLRELSFTFMAPDDLARRFGTDGLSLTVSGRNLHTWTNYSGIDPEVNFAGRGNYNTADFLTQPPVRYWTARLDVTF